MQFKALPLFVSLLPAIVTAQTPAGFTPSVNVTLQVAYGNNTISPAGERVPRGELASPPSLATSVVSFTGKSILFMIDLDVPRNGTRVPLLHWLATDVTPLVAGSNSTTLSVPLNGPGAPYLQPSPPAGDSPHRYVFLLFSQPLNFTFPPAFAAVNPPTDSTARVGFNYTGFFRAAGLQAPLAANYITVQNTSAPATSTSFPPSSFTTTVSGGGSGSSATTTSGSGSGSSATARASSTAGAAANAVNGGSGMAFVMAAAWLFSGL